VLFLVLWVVCVCVLVVVCSRSGWFLEAVGPVRASAISIFTAPYFFK
jgi:hypothetical protein